MSALPNPTIAFATEYPAPKLRALSEGSIERVVLINDASVARGGATGIVLETLRLLGERGIEALLICGDDGSGFSGSASEVEPLGGVHIANAARRLSIVNGLYNRSAARRVSQWVKAHDTAGTIYHLHGWSKILSPSIFAALKPVARRVVIHAHDFFLVCPNGGYFDFQTEVPCTRTPLSLDCIATNCDRRSRAQKLWRSARQGIRRSLVKLEPGEIGGIVAVHGEMLPHLVRGGIDARCVKVLRNPVEAWTYPRVEAERNRNFVFIGRLELDKGPDLLARAARQAGVPVRFIGDGPLQKAIVEMNPDAVMLGRLSRRDIVDELRNARVLVMPSRTRETFGLAAFEAMSAGVPVVVPSFAMIAAEVTREKFGLAINPYDTDAMAAVLLNLAENDPAVQAMSRAAHLRSRFFAPSPGEWADQLLEIYADALHAAQN
jgi:glycosyltransferase involved in cell wall biosynthesis